MLQRHTCRPLPPAAACCRQLTPARWVCRANRKVWCVNPDTRRFEVTDKFDNEWMTALVGIQQRPSTFNHYFRVPNRVDKHGTAQAPLGMSDLAFTFRQVPLCVARALGSG